MEIYIWKRVKINNWVRHKIKSELDLQSHVDD